MRYNNFLRPLSILACAASLLGAAGSVLAAGPFSVGNKISVVVAVNVRNASSTSPSAVVLGTQYAGATGIIKEAGTKIVDGYWWYRIDYDNSTLDGWSVPNSLELYKAPVPTDTVKPAAPTGFTATKVSSSKIDLAWTAPADADIAGYYIYRDNAATPTITVTGTPGCPKTANTSCVYHDTNLYPSHSYSYKAATYDQSGNISSKAGPASAATDAVTGATFKSGDRISTNGNANVRSAPYGSVIGTQTMNASGSIKSGPVINGGYTWWEVNYDSGFDGWTAEISLIAYAASVPTDTVKPAAPTGLTVTPVSSSKVNVSWTASTDNVKVTGYSIYRDNTQIGTSVNAAYSDTTVTPSHSYSYYVIAYDAAGNVSVKSASVNGTTPAVAGSVFKTGDKIMNTTSVNVRSAPSIYGTVLATKSTGNRGTIASGPVTANGYTWWEVAYNGGPKGWSIETYLKMDDSAAADKTAPATPADLTDMVVTGGVQLDWMASTDEGSGIAGYKIYRGGVLIATTVGTAVTYKDTTVIPGHTYTYQVAAYDTAGNTSAKSEASKGRAGSVAGAKFNRSDRISLIEVSNVRSSAGVYTLVKGKQAVGAIGTILSGPVTANGYTWWEVNYDSGVDGWSVETYMKKI